jgi:predicted peroxiredoxin
MAPDEPQKLVIVATHGMDNPELATVPLVVGNAALAMDTKVVLILQSAGVAIATKGIYEHISAVGFDPVQKLLGSFLEFGGKILVCIPCLEPRKITPENLVQGAEPAKAGRVVTELLGADAVVCY